MKAVLVLDEMPESCEKCPLLRYDVVSRIGCAVTSNIVLRKVWGEKPDWCPLRPMPERVYYGRDCSEWDDGYQSGVAATLRAIEENEIY